MAVYSVFFELTPDPLGLGPDLRKSLGDVPAILAELGSMIQVSSTACFVACNLSADEVMERLWPKVLGPGERILVLPVDLSVAYRFHSADADDHLIKWMGQQSGI